MDSYFSNLESTVSLKEMKNSDFPPNILYENRYCNQDDFSILICGGRDENDNIVKTILKMYGPKLKFKKYTYLPERFYNCKTAAVNSDLFVVGKQFSINNANHYVRKFCKNTKTWLYETKLDVNWNSYSICSFKQNIYVFESWVFRSKCTVYNIKDDKWSQIADLNEGRKAAAFTVFEGKIVVSGGYYKGTSVEAFDYYENRWYYFPDMIEKRRDHALVSMGNKMFVIGGYGTSTCEVFDSYSRKFTYIESISCTTQYLSGFEAVCIGQTIVAFSMNRTRPYGTVFSKVFVYEVNKNQWTEKKRSVLKNLTEISCVKYYDE